jgi:cation transport protein ChaC
MRVPGRQAMNTDRRSVRRILTRELLSDDRFIDTFKAQLPPGSVVRSSQELETSLRMLLGGRDPRADVHVFGYGSLMWNPAVDHREIVKGRIHGWHRSFCIRAVVGRGSAEIPGLMLGLDRGGSCNGALIRIAAAVARQELSVIWRREMLSAVYDARWVDAVGADGIGRRAITFVVNRGHPRYTRGLTVEQMASMINAGRGTLGSCRDYFDETMQKLDSLGIIDSRMESLRIATQAGPRR